MFTQSRNRKLFKTAMRSMDKLLAVPIEELSFVRASWIEHGPHYEAWERGQLLAFIDYMEKLVSLIKARRRADL